MVNVRAPGTGQSERRWARERSGKNSSAQSTMGKLPSSLLLHLLHPLTQHCANWAVMCPKGGGGLAQRWKYKPEKTLEERQQTCGFSKNGLGSLQTVEKQTSLKKPDFYFR